MLQFQKKLEVVAQPIELTQEQWEQAKRETAQAMAEQFGERRTAEFLKGIGGAPPPFITVKDYTVE